MSARKRISRCSFSSHTCNLTGSKRSWNTQKIFNDAVKTDSGIELLIHVGIDTVKLNGEGFQIVAKEGQHLNKGDVIMNFDMEKIRGTATAMSTPVICTELEGGQKVTVLRYGDIKAGEKVIQIDI